MNLYFALQLVFASTLATAWIISGASTSPNTAENACEKPKLLNFSSVAPSSPLHRDITMYCVVRFKDTATSDNATGTWSQRPDHVTTSSSNISFTNQHLPGNRFQITLFLKNVTKNANAVYILTVKFMNGKCSFSCPTISLKVENECYNKEPEPMDNNMTIINTNLNVPFLRLAANYSGDMDSAHYKVCWWKGHAWDDEIQTGNKYSIKTYNKQTFCSFTDELIIYNLSVNDAGLYTAVVTGIHGFTSKRTYFQVNIEQNSKMRFLPLLSIAVGAVAIVTVGVCICVCIQRRGSHREVERSGAAQQLLDSHYRDTNEEELARQYDPDDDVERDHVEADGAECRQATWQTVPCGLLEIKELALIADAITQLDYLVPYLRLSPATIEEVTKDNMGYHKEQKYHMLLRWSKQQSTHDTRKRLVRIIEEEMKEPVLAQKVTQIIHKCLTESE